MNKKLFALTACVFVFQPAVTQANPAFTGTYAKAQGSGTDISDPFPSTFTPISNNDLAESSEDSFSSISGVDTGGRPDTVARLFDGVAAAGSNFEAQFDTGSFTINFNTSRNINGYDVTGINTYSASDPSEGGRSDQEFTITAIFTDNSTQTLTSGTHYHNDNTPGENGETNVWTEVKFNSPTGVIAKRVKALQFDFETRGNSGDSASYTEFDIIGSPSSAPREFVHPGIGFTTDDLDAVKANLGVEPWKSGYEEMLSVEQSSLDYQMRGPLRAVGRREGAGDFASDIKAVHNMARIWYFTGDEDYAEKARDILMAWANNHEEFLAGETYLTMGYEAFRIFEGADLLRGAWSGWDSRDTETLKRYFSDVWLNDGLDHLAVPSPMRSANQGMAQFAAAINIAVFNDDEELFDQLVHIFRTDGSSALTSSLPNGQVGDSGRDAHDQGQILLWARSAETIWQQGIDVYSELDSRMLAAGEYISRANLQFNTPFIQAGTVYDIYPSYHFFDEPGTSISAETTMVNLLHSAYITRMGMKSYFLELYTAGASGRPDTYTYLVPSDDSTAEAPLPVQAPAEVASVTRLNSANMGDASGGGSTYDNGTWTITGQGTSLRSGSSPDYRFSFLPVRGDATIIARLDSFSGGGDSNAQAGLVFTESLNNANKMGGVVITAPGPDDDLESFFRGQLASSHNSSSNGKPRQTQPRIPYWLKIERIGNRITTFSSPDGASWSIAHVGDFDMGATAYYGLAVSADNNNNSATATFSDVRITNGDGGEAVETPDAPFAIYASSAGSDVTLRWLESFEADFYRIWRSTQSGGSPRLLTEQTGTSYIDTETNPGTSYFYSISAVNEAGESARSAQEQLQFADLSQIQAENFDDENGIRLEQSRDIFGGQNLAFINGGDWARYNDIQIESTDPVFELRTAGFGDSIGDVEVRVGSQNGTLIGIISPQDTGEPQRWATSETTLSVDPGVYDLFLVFTGGGVNVNWFRIVGSAPSNPVADIVNLALDGSASQSSLAYGGSAGRAIDDNTSGVYRDGSVTHTRNVDNSFWQVNLQQPSDISEIVIWNRVDCCTERLSDFTVKVLDANGDTVWERLYADQPSPSLSINPGVTGTSVRVELDGTLSLAEVQVFGSESIGKSAAVR